MPPRKRTPRKPAAPPSLFQDMTADQIAVVTGIQAAQAANERHFVLWYGSVRSGKTVGAVMGLLAHTLNKPAGLYIIGTNTIRQGLSIVAPYAEKYAAELGIKTKVNRGNQAPRITFDLDDGTAEWLIFNGGEAGREKGVQGITADGLFLDELSLLHPDFVAQAEARVSRPGGVRIYTSNKTTPYHWTTTLYYDRAMSGAIRCHMVDTDITGNQFLAQDYVDERMSEYSGEYLARFMQNRFMLDHPPIYEPLSDTAVNWQSPPDLSIVFGVGRAALAVQCRDTEYGLLLADVLNPVVPELLADYVLINSGKPMLARRLAKAGKRVRGYSGVVGDRHLDTLHELFADGAVRVNSNCVDLARAFDQYHTPFHNREIPMMAIEGAAQHLRRRVRNHATES